MKFMRKKSFTLIEVLVAMMVFSIGTVGLYSTMMMARSAQVSAKNRLLAMRIVNEKLDELMQIEYEYLYDKRAEYSPKVEGIPARTWSFSTLDDLKDYSGSLHNYSPVVYTLVSPNTNEHYCRVDVYVRWVDPQLGELEEASYIYVYDVKVGDDG